jgi:hypothetical protein
MLPPAMWNGQYYGEMQKQINDLHKEGFRHFEVWDVENNG